MEEKKIGRAKAIRLKCLDCSNKSFAEVKNCPIRSCPLYSFRMGSVPKEQMNRNKKSPI